MYVQGLYLPRIGETTTPYVRMHCSKTDSQARRSHFSQSTRRRCSDSFALTSIRPKLLAARRECMTGRRACSLELGVMLVVLAVVVAVPETHPERSIMVGRAQNKAATTNDVSEAVNKQLGLSATHNTSHSLSSAQRGIRWRRPPLQGGSPPAGGRWP